MTLPLTDYDTLVFECKHTDEYWQSKENAGPYSPEETKARRDARKPNTELSEQELADITTEAEWMARLWNLDIDALLETIPTISESEEITNGTDSFSYRNQTNSTIFAESIPNAVDSISNHEILSK